MVEGVATVAAVLVRAMRARAEVVVVDYDARSGAEEIFVGGDVAVVGVGVPVNGRTASSRRSASTGAAGDGTAGDGVIRGMTGGSVVDVVGCLGVAVIVDAIAAIVSGLVGPGRG
jgi:hypothetical protein